MTGSFAAPLLRVTVNDNDEPLRPHGHLSYVCGGNDQPLRFVTVSQALDDTVAAHGTRLAAIFSAEREMLTWQELQRQSDDVAASLVSLGIRRGNRVAIWSPNRREWLLAQFGAARIGAVLVNVDPLCEVSELEDVLNLVRCRVLILARRFQGRDLLGMLKGLAPELDRPGDRPRLEAQRLPHLKHVIVLSEGLTPARAERFSDFLRRAGASSRRRLPALSAALDPDHAINIQFTSGTTGAPKAVTLSHFNIVNNARSAARTMRLTELDRLCIAVPLHQSLGMVLGALACAVTGATMVFPGLVFDALGTLDAVSRHRCTALHGTPGMFEMLLDHPDLPDYDTASLRTGIIAGAPCPIATLERLMEQMSMDEVTVAYGMAEAGPASFQTRIEDAPELRAETVGRVQSNIEAKVIDFDGNIVPIGCRGELCVRGYAVMRGYWEQPDRTRESFDEAGWLHTGDLVTLDAAGYCRIVGRVADRFVRGNVHLYPEDLEALIRSHPKVQDVQVFAVPEGRHDNEICAWVIPRPGADVSANEIKAFCRSEVGQHHLPRHVRFVTDFPLTSTGRAKKFIMRSLMLREIKDSKARSA